MRMKFLDSTKRVNSKTSWARICTEGGIVVGWSTRNRDRRAHRPEISNYHLSKVSSFLGINPRVMSIRSHLEKIPPPNFKSPSALSGLCRPLQSPSVLSILFSKTAIECYFLEFAGSCSFFIMRQEEKTHMGGNWKGQEEQSSSQCSDSQSRKLFLMETWFRSEAVKLGES